VSSVASKIGTQLVIYNAVSLCGSVINSTSYHDVDFVVKSPTRLPALEQLIWDHFGGKEDCDFIYSLQGSSWDHAPVGHFFMTPVGASTKEVVESSPYLPKLEGLKAGVVIPDFMTFDGKKFYVKSFVPDTGMELKITRAIGEAFQFEYVNTLPQDPLFSLSFIPVKKVEVVKVPTTESLRSPFQKIQPMKAKTGYSKFEFYSFDDFWNVWGQTNASTGFYLEPKVDGIRMIGAKKGDKVIIYTEDKKRERQNVLVDLAEEVKKLPVEECVIDGEVVWFKDEKPVPRWDMAELVSGKKPIKGEDLRWFVFDCLYISPQGSLIDEPIEKRRAFLDKIIPRRRPDSCLHRLPSFSAHSREEAEKWFEKCSNFPSSEGAMVKLVGSKYDIEGRTGEWAKVKVAREIHAEVIGVFKKANSFPPGKKPTTTIEGKEALDLYRSLQKDSKTYILRCAVRRGSELVPIDAERRLTESDLSIKWNAETDPPKWQGLDDPSLWEMSSKIKPRKPGDYAFGNTYAHAFDTPPKIGDLVVVRPMKVRLFNGDRISWMFPILHHKDETRTEPDSFDVVKRMAEAVANADEIRQLVSEKAQNAFPNPGSKVRLAPFFEINMPKHTTYVEPFAGAASLFFSKGDKAQKEVLNDLEPDLIAFYLELKKDPKGFVSYLRTKDFRVSRVRFDRIRKWKPLRRRDKAFKHIYLSWMSFEGKKRSPRITWDYLKLNLDRRFKKLEDLGERLQGVQITSEDGIACIKKWDSPNTFFYLDPPYPKAGKGLFDLDDFSYKLEDFASLLGKLKGKFLLSLNDIPETRAAFRKPGFYVYQIITPYPRFALKGFSNKYSELLISNYPLPKPSATGWKRITSVKRIYPAGGKTGEANREEQRKKAEKELGDWYMVESSKVLPTRIQYHVRGILVGDELAACKNDLKKDRKAAWKKHKLCTIRGSLEELRRDAQKVDDERGDVSGAIASHLDYSPSDAPLDQVYTLGSIHGDWRKPHPDMTSLVSSWTLNVQKSCLQRLSDGEVVYLLRDRVMQNQKNDNFLSEKKCPSVLDPQEEMLFPYIANLVPTVVDESFATLLEIFPDSLREAADTYSTSAAAEIIYESIQPILWLNLVDEKRPVVDVPAASLPEGEGQVLKSSSRFIWVAETRMVYGVQKSDYHEYFHFFKKANQKVPHAPLDNLSGRWNWTKIEGRPTYRKVPKDKFWLGSRPSEQRPYILTHDREKEEAKAAKEKIELVWNEKAIDLLRDMGYRYLS